MKNSEKYKTVEERAFAFKRFCDDMYKKHISGPCPSCPAFGSQCAFRWLDLGAEEEKPLPCPFCGGDAECEFVPLLENGYYRVRCKICRSSTRSCRTEYDAIAAWNRRAK